MSRLPGRARIDAILAYLFVFESPGFEFGKGLGLAMRQSIVTAPPTPGGRENTGGRLGLVR